MYKLWVIIGLIILNIVLISKVSAQQLPGSVVDMPEYLKGATITVTLTNGEQHTFRSEEYKVVPRVGVSNQLGLLLSKTPPTTDNQALPKNRLYVLLGSGYTTFDVTKKDTSFYVRSKREFLYGLGYSRSFDNSYSLGVVGLNNGTLLGTMGKDF